MLEFAPHPLLHPLALIADYPAPLGTIDHELEGPALDSPESPEFEGLAPPPRLGDNERLRQDVRSLLRHGGHKPKGRGKPSSEYLLRAATEGGLPKINAAVDVCNAISLHTGLPISVVDLNCVKGPLRIEIPETGSYVFNASGQEISLDGLLCLFDGEGPIANAVKDSHRTKTGEATTRTLSVFWAPNAHAEHANRAAAWASALFERFGRASVERVGD